LSCNTFDEASRNPDGLPTDPPDFGFGIAGGGGHPVFGGDGLVAGNGAAGSAGFGSAAVSGSAAGSGGRGGWQLLDAGVPGVPATDDAGDEDAGQ
jgi:hypothetical protein